MNELTIPNLIKAGRNNKYLRWSFYSMLLLALLLHIGLFATLSYYGKHPFNFFFPEEIIPAKQEEHLNFVLVDDKLLDEEVKDEKIAAIGKASRQSRDELVNPDLPKLGPSNATDSKVIAFKNGNPLPNSIATPEISPSPPPIPEVKPQKAAKPTRPTKPKPMPKPKEQSQEKILPALPELEIKDDLTGILPNIKKAQKPKEAKKFDDLEVPGITSSDKISKIKEEPIKQPEAPKLPKTQQTPAKKPQKPQRKVPTRKIPVRQIGSKNSSTGGKMTKRLNSSAINAGSKSIAVLRSRYGAYMDKILRRIQQAIIIQQQINPISMHEGNVIMSFTINPSGILDQIKFINSAPQGITTEVSAARSVLVDVQNSGPFERPTQQMLNDPDFQDIIINFVFASR